MVTLLAMLYDNATCPLGACMVDLSQPPCMAHRRNQIMDLGVKIHCIQLLHSIRRNKRALQILRVGILSAGHGYAPVIPGSGQQWAIEEGAGPRTQAHHSKYRPQQLQNDRRPLLPAKLHSLHIPFCI